MKIEFQFLLFYQLLFGFNADPFPYFEPDRVEQIYADTNILDFSKIHLAKQQDFNVLNGPVFIQTTLGNNFQVEYLIHRQENGEMQRVFRHPPRPLCDFFNDDQILYPDLARQSDFPEDIKRNCPLTKGVYQLKAVILRLEKVSRGIAKTGTYMGEMFIRINERLVLHWRIYGIIP